MGKRGPRAAKDKSGAKAWNNKALNGGHKTKAPPVEGAAEDLPALSYKYPPRWLKGKAPWIWRRIAPHMEKQGLLKPVDYHTFARYCDLFNQWWQCREVLLEKGRSVETFKEGPGGELYTTMIRERPEAKAYDSLCDKLRMLERELGLSASARKSIEPEPETDPADDPLAAFDRAMQEAADNRN